jgi:hypothetical protein
MFAPIAYRDLFNFANKSGSLIPLLSSRIRKVKQRRRTLRRLLIAPVILRRRLHARVTHQALHGWQISARIQ